MIKMVDLKVQYLNHKEEIDQNIFSVIESTNFINGDQVKLFTKNLENYLSAKYVIPCANGTDALQIALMALDLKQGDEVLVPSFTYAATAEVIALLHLKPIFVDVDLNTFNISIHSIKKSITPKTKVILPVNLYGQCAELEEISQIANQHNIFIIEDNAQAIGADYFLSNDKQIKAGLIGDIGCTSFFPSKNLGCYGDGGAIYTNNEKIGTKLKMIANHGQSKKYHHEIIGVNSRLDSIQAAILNVKLKYLDAYNQSRQRIASFYDEQLKAMDGINIPQRTKNSSHVFHQYTLKVKNGKRNYLKEFLNKNGISSTIYYPIPLHRQNAYKKYHNGCSLKNSEILCDEVLSIPIYPEMPLCDYTRVVQTIKSFFE